MLSLRQAFVCVSIAVAFWLSATVYVNRVPLAFTDPAHGAISFVTALPLGWVCIWLTCRLARLAPHQVLSGVLLVLACSMLTDGIAVRWFHQLYSADERTCRLASAWLLWGYGASAAVTLMLVKHNNPNSSRQPTSP